MNAPRKAGRPVSDRPTPSDTALFCGLLRQGMSITSIIKELNITQGTYQTWLRDGKYNRFPHRVEFFQAWKPAYVAWQEVRAQTARVKYAQRASGATLIDTPAVFADAKNDAPGNLALPPEPDPLVTLEPTPEEPDPEEPIPTFSMQEEPKPKPPVPPTISMVARLLDLAAVRMANGVTAPHLCIGCENTGIHHFFTGAFSCDCVCHQARAFLQESAT